MLTRRQKQLVELLVGGLSVKEAAAKMGCAYGTAVTHLDAVHKRLGVHSRAQLVVRFQSLG